MISDRREKIDAAFRRRFGPGVSHVLAEEVDKWECEIFERVHARIRAMPNLTSDVAALILKGETDAAGKMLADAFDAAFSAELTS
jgi:hypothetical protein